MVLALRLFQNQPPIPQKPVRVISLLLIVAFAIIPVVSIPQSKRLEIVFPDTVSPLSSASRMPSSVSVCPDPAHFPSMTLPTMRFPERAGQSGDQRAVAGAIVITWPRDGDVFLVEPGYDPRTQSLRLAAAVEPRQPEVTWTLDGRPIASAGWPYEADWPLAPGRHVLEAMAAGSRSDPVRFEVR
jgi:hypothetical protein